MNMMSRMAISVQLWQGVSVLGRNIVFIFHSNFPLIVLIKSVKYIIQAVFGFVFCRLMCFPIQTILY